MGKTYVSELEELILTLVAAFPNEAYGGAIARVLQTRIKRQTKLGAVHTTLYRLEEKAYIVSSYGGATNRRGGRRKRMYTITRAGIEMLNAIKTSRIRLWRLVPQMK